jgi:hypothetical protein
MGGECVDVVASVMGRLNSANSDFDDEDGCSDEVGRIGDGEENESDSGDNVQE